MQFRLRSGENKNTQPFRFFTVNKIVFLEMVSDAEPCTRETRSLLSGTSDWTAARWPAESASAAQSATFAVQYPQRSEKPHQFRFSKQRPPHFAKSRQLQFIQSHGNGFGGFCIDAEQLGPAIRVLRSHAQSSGISLRNLTN